MAINTRKYQITVLKQNNMEQYGVIDVLMSYDILETLVNIKLHQ